MQATELEAGFARGRTIALLMAGNPSFARLLRPSPALACEKVAAQGSTIDRVHKALAYLEKLYPGQIGEVSFIDRSGVENARVVRGDQGAPSELSDESKNAFFTAVVRADVWAASTSRRRMSRRIRASG